MSEHYLESYLISLGFDLNSEDGQRYLNMARQIDKAGTDSEKNAEKADQQKKRRDQDAEKAGKRSVADTQKQTAALSDLQRSLRQIGNVWDSIASGDVIGALFSGATGISSLQRTIESAQKLWESAFSSEAPKAPFKSTAQANEQPKAAESKPEYTENTSSNPRQEPESSSGSSSPTPEPRKTQHAATKSPSVATGTAAASVIYSQGIVAGQKAFDGLNKSILSTNESMKALKTTSALTIGGDGTAMAGAEAANMASSSLISSVASGNAIAAIVVAVVAGTIKITKGLYDMADGISTASTNLESLSAKMWISYGAAFQLQNTLSAMGKTTADLNDIALNPTLRQQFQTLQEFQKEQLQLPADFKNVNDQWAESVQLPLDELKETGSYLKEMTAYDLEKSLVTPFQNLLVIVAPMVADLKAMVDGFNKISGLMAALNQYSPLHLLAQGVGKAASGGSLDSSSGSISSSVATSTMQTYDVPSYSSLAPNSTSNAYDNSSEVHYTNSPSIKVYTSSDDPQGIASAVSGAVQSSSNEAALVKVLQGVSR